MNHFYLGTFDTKENTNMDKKRRERERKRSGISFEIHLYSAFSYSFSFSPFGTFVYLYVRHGRDGHSSNRFRKACTIIVTKSDTKRKLIVKMHTHTKHQTISCHLSSNVFSAKFSCCQFHRLLFITAAN